MFLKVKIFSVKFPELVSINRQEGKRWPAAERSGSNERKGGNPVRAICSEVQGYKQHYRNSTPLSKVTIVFYRIVCKEWIGAIHGGDVREIVDKRFTGFDNDMLNFVGPKKRMEI